MKSTKWITMAAVVTLTASLAVAAPHEGGKRGRHGKGGGEIGERLAQKLHLTEAQQAQVKSLQTSFREQNQEFFQSSQETRKAFREARRANDTAKLAQLEPAMEAQRAQFKSLREAHMQQLLTILTPEQRTQFAAMKAEREARRGNKQRGGERF